MRNRIIIDGFDNCGKTTIANALSKYLTVPVFKNKAEKELFNGSKFNFDTNLQYVGPFILSYWEQTLASGQGIILDRFTPSEFAYGYVYRRQTDFNLLGKLDRQLASLGFVFIHCHKRYFNEYEDELVDISLHKELTEEFFRYESLTDMSALSLDTTDENLTKQLETILSFLERVK